MHAPLICDFSFALFGHAFAGPGTWYSTAADWEYVTNSDRQVACAFDL